MKQVSLLLIGYIFFFILPLILSLLDGEGKRFTRDGGGNRADGSSGPVGGGGGGVQNWHHPPQLQQARNFSLHLLLKIAYPVLQHASEHTLSQLIPSSVNTNRNNLSSMEAFARTFAGIAPWIEANYTDNREENALKHKYLLLARLGIRSIFNYSSPNWVNFTVHNQAVIELGHITLGLIRAPTRLWESFTPSYKHNVIEILKQHRNHKIPHNNWILYSALIEAFIWKYYPEESKFQLVDYGVRRTMTWYVGDGWYSDGSLFHFDYYNSIAIHPLLVEIMVILAEKGHPLATEFYKVVIGRAQRHAKQLEMLISPEASLPMFGRSNVYRFGVFHLLSQLITLQMLPDYMISNLGALRSGLTAVIYRFTHAKQLFDREGWLVEGVIGSQPSKLDYYINRGSLYLCTFGLLHVSLPPKDQFWVATDKQWTQRAIWTGSQSVAPDYPEDWK